ncbi:hypothetical protein [Natrinema salaciae]|uniref:Uncharacterized protein n=1 Tax=Natrinema salaciae TaxID=1186196 RepID=A0A1H9ADN0_9EURY|nr:hypothetical protein [Natrinema salaciae]SEP74705.1 hypothetical protein SAMN04489841_0421 [Natrinema salaciae]
MSDGDEAGDDTNKAGDDTDEVAVFVEPAPVSVCPRCGDPVSFAVVTPPESGTLEPCGCGMPPDLLEQVRGG